MSIVYPLPLEKVDRTLPFGLAAESSSHSSRRRVSLRKLTLVKIGSAL